MITLRPINQGDIKKLSGTSYADMPSDKIIEMIANSESEIHNGKFFKFMLVEIESDLIGVINICGHSESVVSIAPEIKENYRRKGYAKRAKLKAIEYVKSLGYTIEYAGISEDNVASIRLHESLGYEYVQDFFSLRGKKLKLYIKSI